MSDGRKNNGGPRPGAGRPAKALEDASQSVLLELFNEKEEKAIVKNMIENAKRAGATSAPSAISAATWLWDRKYGKVKDQIEQSGGLTIKVVYAEPGSTTDPTEAT